VPQGAWGVPPCEDVDPVGLMTTTTYNDAVAGGAETGTHRNDPEQGAWTDGTWPSAPPGADTTTWNDQEASGLLQSKVDAQDAAVTYVEDSDLISAVDKQGSPAVRLTRGYEDHRDLVIGVTNLVGVATVSQYNYAYDPARMRTSVVNQGSAFQPARLNLWEYNDRYELTFLGSHPHIGHCGTGECGPAGRWHVCAAPEARHRCRSRPGSSGKAYQFQ